MGVLLFGALILCASIPPAVGTVEVFVVPHSHCDAGWLRTYKHYTPLVNSILNEVMKSLLADKNRRFVWSEIAFFMPWYTTLDKKHKQDMISLIENEQFEFVGGGWVQHDEALTSLDSIVSQMTDGHLFLWETFNVKPSIGWQIDPFGHSLLTAELADALGFDAVVLNRISASLKSTFRKNQNLEFLWQLPTLESTKEQKSPTKPSSVLAHVLYDHYSSPKGFAFEKMGREKLISPSTIQHKAKTFCEQMLFQARSYKHDYVLVPFGDDFGFLHAELMFSNMTGLMKHINDNQDTYGVHMQFATLSEYFQTLRDSGAVDRLPMYKKDFFPYQRGKLTVWSGFYASRSYLKGRIREAERAVMRADQLYSIAMLDANITIPTTADDLEDEFQQSKFLFPISNDPESAGDSLSLDEIIRTCRRNLDILAHHDAVTGTARDVVIHDYLSRIDWIIDFSNRVNSILSNLVMLVHANFDPSMFSTDFPVDSIGENPQHISFLVHNTLAWPQTQFIRIPVPHHIFAVYDSQQILIPSQIVPDIEEAIQCDELVYPACEDVEHYWMVFEATVPAMGCAMYFLSANDPVADDIAELSSVEVRKSGGRDDCIEVERGELCFGTINDANMSIANSYLKIIADGKGSIQALVDQSSSKETELSHYYLEYASLLKEFSGGPYAFRPELGIVLGIGVLSGFGLHITILVSWWAVLQIACIIYAMCPFLQAKLPQRAYSHTRTRTVKYTPVSQNDRLTSPTHDTEPVVEHTRDEDCSAKPRWRRTLPTISEIQAQVLSSGADTDLRVGVEMQPLRTPQGVLRKRNGPSDSSGPRSSGSLNNRQHWSDDDGMEEYGIERLEEGRSEEVEDELRLNGGVSGQREAQNPPEEIHERKYRNCLLYSTFALIAMIVGAIFGSFALQFHFYPAYFSGLAAGFLIPLIIAYGKCAKTKVQVFAALFFSAIGSVLTFAMALFYLQSVHGAPFGNDIESVVLIRGVLFESIHVTYGNNITTTYSLFNSSDVASSHLLHVNYNVEANLGTNLAARFMVKPFDSGQKFYTDRGIGMGFTKRNLRKDIILPGNFYPITSEAYIEDEHTSDTFHVITQQSMGAASLYDGLLEFMLHRSIDHTDDGGMGEGTVGLPASIPMWGLLNHRNFSRAEVSKLSIALNHPFAIFFSIPRNKNPGQDLPAVWKASFHEKYTPLQTVSDCVHLQSMLAHPRNSLINQKMVAEFGENCHSRLNSSVVDVTAVRLQVLSEEKHCQLDLEKQLGRMFRNYGSYCVLERSLTLSSPVGRVKTQKRLRTFLIGFP